MAEIEPIRILEPSLIEVLDQTRLPHEEVRIALRDIDVICEAIASLRVRGAPLLGLTGACGLMVAATTLGADDATLAAAAARIGATRPTAVDLGAATQEALRMAQRLPEGERVEALFKHARAYLAARILEDRRMGELGAPLLSSSKAVLTHCNSGALASAGIGTALGVIRTAWEHGTLARCYATETRPLLQGARLTMWELKQLGIPATLLPDTAAASLIASGQVQAVITGADRIAANGDTANKVGTYGLAVLAARHGIPFYIAAPVSTIDPDCPSGAAIPIEQRDSGEVGGFGVARWSPEGQDTYNPAFDVTPAELIGAIVTEASVLRPPYGEAIAALVPRFATTS